MSAREKSKTFYNREKDLFNLVRPKAVWASFQFCFVFCFFLSKTLGKYKLIQKCNDAFHFHCELALCRWTSNKRVCARTRVCTHTHSTAECEDNTVLGLPAGTYTQLGSRSNKIFLHAAVIVRVTTRYAGHISLAFMENY